MKRLIYISVLLITIFSLQALGIETEKIQFAKGSQPADQDQTVTARLKSASRLFKDKEDLTSVILIIPSGSIVTVLGSDSTYFKVNYEDTEGYVYRSQAEINPTPVVTENQNQPENNQTAELTPQQKQVKRYDYLEYKYGTTMANKLMAGKIWKGMSAEMVQDSWGSPVKINREIGDVVREEWIYPKTWLFIENNTLVSWGPVKK